MRSHSVTAAALAAALLLVHDACAADTPAAGPPLWQAMANVLIASHARRVGGDAPKEARRFCEGDVDGDGQPDAVVVYTIESVGGGNDWNQYMAVLSPQGGTYRASATRKVGGKGERGVEQCTIAPGFIDLAFKSYGPADAACCPSVPGHERYAYRDGKIVDPAKPTATP